MIAMYSRLVIIASKFAQTIVRLAGKSSGTALPGLIAEKLSPNIATYFAQQLNNRIILVTGTNGKTTTARLLSASLRNSGFEVVANSSGSNFTRGIIGSLLEKSDFSGKLKTANGKLVAVFEVDEAFVERVSKVFEPNTILVLNIFRDQLDRFGELDTVAYMLGQSLAYTKNAVLNLQDPLVWDLKKYCGENTNIVSFGVAEALQNNYTSDEELHGKRRLKTDKKPDVTLQERQQQGAITKLRIDVNDETHKLSTQLPGLHNAINTAASVAVLGCTEILSKKEQDRAFASFREIAPPFGRGELIDIGDGRDLLITLVKNPAGMNQIVRSFLQQHEYSIVGIVLNDNYADGRDVSWVWDADLESAKLSKTQVVVSGRRSYDMALRLKYMDQDAATQENIGSMTDYILENLPQNKSAIIVSTYTGMLQLRDEMRRRGHGLARIHQDD